MNVDGGGPPVFFFSSSSSSSSSSSKDSFQFYHFGGGGAWSGGPCSFLFNREKSRSEVGWVGGGFFDRSKRSVVYEKTFVWQTNVNVVNCLGVLGVIVCVSNKNGKIKSKRVNRIAANDLARLFTESSEILNSANFNLVSTRDESVEMGRGDERKNSDIIFEGLIFFEGARREAATIVSRKRTLKTN